MSLTIRPLVLFVHGPGFDPQQGRKKEGRKKGRDSDLADFSRSKKSKRQNRGSTPTRVRHGSLHPEIAHGTPPPYGSCHAEAWKHRCKYSQQWELQLEDTV